MNTFDQRPFVLKSKKIDYFFSEENLLFIRQQLRNFLPTVIVPQEIIINVMNSIYRNYQPVTGDIYSRYTIPNSQLSVLDDMNSQTVNIIVNNISSNLNNERNNFKLDQKVVVLGEFNKWGLRGHDVLKINKKSRPMLFSMRY